MASRFRIEPPHDVRNDVHDLAIIFEEEAIGDAHRAGFCDAANVVAAEVEQHEMLCALLGVRKQIRGQAFVILGSCASRARSGDRPDGDLSLMHAHKDFRA